jgi:tRNA(Ile)-lysidine synthase
MPSVPELLRQKLESDLVPGSEYCVALSGGLDSSVLLHAMCQLRGAFKGIAVRAIHVNHDLHPHADEWAAECEVFCRKLDLTLQSERVLVDRNVGEGVEAAARRARYGLFAEVLGKDEYLLTAHHQDDQVETLLLRLLRGSGTRGLASIAERRQFGCGWLLRPLLELSRTDLEAYARSAGINWVDDPSNVDTSIDRNFLRHAVVPALRSRWPGMGKTIGRAARLSRESAELLDVLAEVDGRNLIEGHAMDAAGLRRLDPARQRNLVRYHIRSRGLAVPSEAQLRIGVAQLLAARADAQPVLRWPEGQIRRYRERLYLLGFDPDTAAETSPEEYRWCGLEALEMGPVRGRLRLEAVSSGGLAESYVAEGVVIRFRCGGERIQQANQQHHKSLKKLFQSTGVVPWMRRHVPLIYARDQLLAVADRWIAAGAAAGPNEPGYRLIWENHPETE